eukprot:gene53249-biopygen63996
MCPRHHPWVRSAVPPSSPLGAVRCAPVITLGCGPLCPRHHPWVRSAGGYCCDASRWRVAAATAADGWGGSAGDHHDAVPPPSGVRNRSVMFRSLPSPTDGGDVALPVADVAGGAALPMSGQEAALPPDRGGGRYAWVTFAWDNAQAAPFHLALVQDPADTQPLNCEFTV